MWFTLTLLNKFPRGHPLWIRLPLAFFGLFQDNYSLSFSLGYSENSYWGNEGDFRWHDLPPAAYRIDWRFRRDRHRHPFFILRNNATGEHFVGQLAWCAEHNFELDLDAAPQGNWWATVKDWEVNCHRFPEGNQPIRLRVHEKDMLWGRPCIPRFNC